MTKTELINKVDAIVREACYGWELRYGLASQEHIETEQKRIREDGNAIIEYIKTHY